MLTRRHASANARRQASSPVTRGHQQGQSDPRAAGPQVWVHTHVGKLSNTQAWAHGWLAAYHTWLCRERTEKFSRDIFILHAGVSTVVGDVCTPD